MINRDLKKRWCVTNIRARLNKIRTKRKKFTYKVLVVALKKKTQDFLSFFSRRYLYFPDFFHVWKVAEQISRLFQEFKTLCEPWIWEERKLTMENGSSLPLLTTIFPHTPSCQGHFVYSQAIPRFFDHLRSGWLPLKISLRSKRFRASSSKKLGREPKKGITRLETLATQATQNQRSIAKPHGKIGHRST